LLSLTWQQILSALYDSAPFAVLITDVDRRIVTCNSAFEDLLGFAKDEIAGRSTELLYPSGDDFVGLKPVYKALVEGASTLPTEIRYKRKTGEIILADTQGSVVRDDNGNIVAMIGIIQNISQQRQIEQEFAGLFNYAPVYILQKDANNKILRINTLYASLFGLKPEEAVGRNLNDIQPNLADVMRDEDRSVIESKQPLIGILHEISSPTRGKIWVRVNKIPFKSAVSGEDTILVIAMDVTELVHREAELESKTRNLESFAHAASHDLQEPLRKITMFASVFADNESNAEDRDHAVSVVTESARRARETISNLLTYSRTNNEEMKRTRFDFSILIHEVLESLSVLIDEAGATIDVRVKNISLNADRNQASHLLQNLITNAVKYRRSGHPCRITIDAELIKGNALEFFISDNGIGFDIGFAERIFDPFIRLHGHTDIPGTGLGLAICKAVTDSHEWQIRADLRDENGAKFTITIPADQYMRGQSVSDKSAVIASSPGGKR